MRKCVAAAAGDLPGVSLPDRALLVLLAEEGWLVTAKVTFEMQKIPAAMHCNE